MNNDHRLTYVLLTLVILAAIIGGVAIGASIERAKMPEVIQIDRWHYDTLYTLDTVWMIEKQYIVRRDTVTQQYVIIDTMYSSDTVIIFQRDKMYYAERVLEDSTLTAVAGCYAYGPIQEISLSAATKIARPQAIEIKPNKPRQRISAWAGAGWTTHNSPAITAGVTLRGVGAGVYASTGEVAAFFQMRIHGGEKK